MTHTDPIKLTIATLEGDTLEINSTPRGALAVHRTASGRYWTVTHRASGHAVTGGRTFDSEAQATRFAVALQEKLDFNRLKPNADMAWDAVATFGNETIRLAMSHARQEAHGS